MSPSGPRGRRRLSRTLSRSRWGEYREFLEGTLGAGYDIVALDEWVRRGFPRESRTLVLRHDVDQHPASALSMLEVEYDLGIRATWYFRWRTADPSVIAAVREAGGAIGLHYETLTRLALARGVHDASGAADLVTEARPLLREELAAFRARHGDGRSACPHGDSRVPEVRNVELLRDQDWPDYGIEFDGNEVVRRKRLKHWLTDRSAADGSWGGELTPKQLTDAGTTPILCVTHPNNWVSGGELWKDRLLAGTLPKSDSGLSRGPVRTRPDSPPPG